MSLILVSLLFCVYPFGPAIQNLGLTVFVLASAFFLRSRQHAAPKPRMLAAQLIFISMAAFLLWNVFSTWMNPDNHDQGKLPYFIGYAPLIVLPWLASRLPKLSEEAERRLLTLAAVIVGVWALVATSQYFFAWRWVGAYFAEAPSNRSQGFYSHPMSLAYASLILWPLSMRMVLRFPRQWQSWCLGIGNALLLVFSMSRIAQCLAAAFALWNIFSLLNGRQRLLALSLAVLTGLLLAVTDNPVSVRFRHLFHPTPEELVSDYKDDRLAFWHAHLLMIEERPLLGHGVHLGLQFRKPYYERLGLGDFPKQYQAHNQYLQILAEGGVIALLLYLVWMGAVWLTVRLGIREPFIRSTAQQCLLIFAFGSVTQNAFDDSCVRMGVIILVSLIFLKLPETKPKALATA